MLTSAGAVFPPHSQQRSWWSGIRLKSVDPSTLNNTALTGGQRVSTAIPTVRLHMRHAISAANTGVLVAGSSTDL
jgi:hypothetical protein